MAASTAIRLDALARARNEQPPRTKADAFAWRDRVRGEIRAGTFVDPDATPSSRQADTRLTLGDVCDHYMAEHVNSPTRRESARQTMRWHIALLRRTEVPAANGRTVPFEEKPIDSIIKADIEALRAVRRAALLRATAAADRCRPGVKQGEVGINRLLARLRHIFTWAITEGYVADTPFKRGAVTVVKLETRAESGRTRRLEPGEEERLLQHSGPFLRALIVAALSTGCRVGELLSLQWHQVRRDERSEPSWLVLPADKTKTAEPRVIPIGPRLRAELEMRRHAPDGTEQPAEAYVFGNECGEPVAFPRIAWMTTVLKAHGIVPVWDAKRKTLAPESRAAFRAIDLHFHDVRREFGSAVLESGADLHDVQLFLGHANITTTSRYLRSTPVRLARALAKLEEGRIRTPFAQTPETPASAQTDAALDNVEKSLIQ